MNATSLLELATTSANTATMDIRFKIETAADAYDRRSNEAADAAMRFALTGYLRTAEIAAELADVYAARARTARRIETLQGDL